MIVGDIAVRTLCAPCGASVEIRLSRINRLARIMDNSHKRKPDHRVSDSRAHERHAMQLELRMTKALNAAAKYAFRQKAQGGRV